MGETGTAPLLRVSGVTKVFGGILAVNEVTMEVGPGESIGLVGPNGAGKTTLFNCICGQLRPERGTVELEGTELLGLPTYRRARMGVSRTYQRIEVFPDMTVREHLVVAFRARWRKGRLWRDLCNLGSATTEERDRVAEVLELVGIADRADVPVASLGLGSCRLVELARALVSEPVLLLADEPSSGLDVHETAELATVLRTLQRERGLALLLVEHDLGMVGRGGRPGHRHGPRQRDRRGSLRRGDGRPRGAPRLPRGDGVSAAVGGQPRAARRPRPALRGRPRVSAAYGPYRALFDVSFAVPAGGITALIGSNGAGKSTVARVVTGLLPSSVGAHPGRRYRRHRACRPTGSPGPGCAHVPEGRGVFADLTVEENLKVAVPPAARPQAGARRPGAGLRGVPRSWAAGASSRAGPSPAASSASCRWPRCWSPRPGCWWPTRSRSAWPR